MNKGKRRRRDLRGIGRQDHGLGMGVSCRSTLVRWELLGVLSRVTQPDLSSGNRFYGTSVETGRSAGASVGTQAGDDDRLDFGGIGGDGETRLGSGYILKTAVKICSLTACEISERCQDNCQVFI